MDNVGRPLRCFLAGSKELAVRVLEELVGQGHRVLGVLSRDLEPGMKPWLEELGHRSLADRAAELGVPVYEGVGVNAPEMVRALAEMELDVLFSVFWGEMLKEPVLNVPRLGCFNLHTAALPRNRGCWPLPWAIIEGDAYAGLTIHKMLPGVDDGPIVAQVNVRVEPGDTGASLHRRTTEAGAWLFAETLPRFADMSYTLTPQDGRAATYHPRGRPYGGQPDPYWSGDRKARFARALDFPPFPGPELEPPPVMAGQERPSVRVMLGFDCDRPRGPFVASEEGGQMARAKFHSLGCISDRLDDLGLPRTLFLCGEWLESMAHLFGTDALRQALRVGGPLVEVADHSWSHSVLKPVAARPDKRLISPRQAAAEYRRNTRLFREVLGLDIPERGYRAPLGHCGGLGGEHAILDTLKRVGVRYVSSDLRGEGDTLYAPLECPDGTPRQPYRYENGLLEIPSHGWQDTAFSGESKTPVEGIPARCYSDIVLQYCTLMTDAWETALYFGRDYFLGLVLHPLDVARYDTCDLFADLRDCTKALGATFCTYGDVWEHWGRL